MNHPYIFKTKFNSLEKLIFILVNLYFTMIHPYFEYCNMRNLLFNSLQ